MKRIITPWVTPEMCKKLLSIVLCVAMIWTSGNLAEATLYAPQFFEHPDLLPQYELVPPGALGRITDYYNANLQCRIPNPRNGEFGTWTRDPRLVILIQDLHAHYGVQKNIAGLLEFLSQKLQRSESRVPSLENYAKPETRNPKLNSIPFALAVEGASGPIDSSIMAEFPDPKIKQEACDYLMKQGELTGMEYFAVMHNQPSLLVGVEDNQAYLIHRDLFRKTLEARTALVQNLTGIQADLIGLRSQLYSRKVQAIQDKADAFDKGQLSTEDYIAYLGAQSHIQQIDLKKDFPTLASMVRPAGAPGGEGPEGKLALHQMTTEFLKTTQGYLTPFERQTLAALAKGQDTHAYYLFLRDFIYQHQLFAEVPIDLAQYLEYLHTSQTINTERLLHESRELVARSKIQVAETPAERDLVQVEHDLSMLIEMTDLRATEPEVRAFGPRLNQFVALCNSLLASNGIPTFDENRVRQLISTSIDYYVMALVRNKPMVDNTLALFESNGVSGYRSDGVTTKWHPASHPDTPSPRHSNTVVLVTGGFHTATIAQMLKERNVSYIVLTPIVDQVTEADHQLYVKRLMGQHLTDDEILAAAELENQNLARRLTSPYVNRPAGLAAGTFGPQMEGLAYLRGTVEMLAKGENLDQLRQVEGQNLPPEDRRIVDDKTLRAEAWALLKTYFADGLPHPEVPPSSTDEWRAYWLEQFERSSRINTFLTRSGILENPSLFEAFTEAYKNPLTHLPNGPSPARVRSNARGVLGAVPHELAHARTARKLGFEIVPRSLNVTNDPGVSIAFHRRGKYKNNLFYYQAVEKTYLAGLRANKAVAIIASTLMLSLILALVHWGGVSDISHISFTFLGSSLAVFLARLAQINYHFYRTDLRGEDGLNAALASLQIKALKAGYPNIWQAAEAANQTSAISEAPSFHHSRLLAERAHLHVLTMTLSGPEHELWSRIVLLRSKLTKDDEDSTAVVQLTADEELILNSPAFLDRESRLDLVRRVRSDAGAALAEAPAEAQSVSPLMPAADQPAAAADRQTDTALLPSPNVRISPHRKPGITPANGIAPNPNTAAAASASGSVSSVQTSQPKSQKSLRTWIKEHKLLSAGLGLGGVSLALSYPVVASVLAIFGLLVWGLRAARNRSQKAGQADRPKQLLNRRRVIVFTIATILIAGIILGAHAGIHIADLWGAHPIAAHFAQTPFDQIANQFVAPHLQSHVLPNITTQPAALNQMAQSLLNHPISADQFSRILAEKPGSISVPDQMRLDIWRIWNQMPASAVHGPGNTGPISMKDFNQLTSGFIGQVHQGQTLQQVSEQILDKIYPGSPHSSQEIHDLMGNIFSKSNLHLQPGQTLASYKFTSETPIRASIYAPWKLTLLTAIQTAPWYLSPTAKAVYGATIVLLLLLVTRSIFRALRRPTNGPDKKQEGLKKADKSSHDGTETSKSEPGAAPSDNTPALGAENGQGGTGTDQASLPPTIEVSEALGTPDSTADTGSAETDVKEEMNKLAYQIANGHTTKPSDVKRFRAALNALLPLALGENEFEAALMKLLIEKAEDPNLKGIILDVLYKYQKDSDNDDIKAQIDRMLAALKALKKPVATESSVSGKPASTAKPNSSTKAPAAVTTILNGLTSPTNETERRKIERDIGQLISMALDHADLRDSIADGLVNASRDNKILRDLIRGLFQAKKPQKNLSPDGKRYQEQASYLADVLARVRGVQPAPAQTVPTIRIEAPSTQPATGPELGEIQDAVSNASGRRSNAANLKTAIDDLINYISDHPDQAVAAQQIVQEARRTLQPKANPKKGSGHANQAVSAKLQILDDADTRLAAILNNKTIRLEQDPAFTGKEPAITRKAAMNLFELFFLGAWGTGLKAFTAILRHKLVPVPVAFDAAVGAQIHNFFERRRYHVSVEVAQPGLAGRVAGLDVNETTKTAMVYLNPDLDNVTLIEAVIHELNHINIQERDRSTLARIPRWACWMLPLIQIPGLGRVFEEVIVMALTAQDIRSDSTLAMNSLAPAVQAEETAKVIDPAQEDLDPAIAALVLQHRTAKAEQDAIRDQRRNILVQRAIATGA